MAEPFNVNFQVHLVLHATLLFALLAVFFFAYTSERVHKLMVNDANELIDKYTMKILKDIDTQTNGVNWNYVNTLGDQLALKYYDIKNKADSQGRSLRRGALLTLTLLVLASIGVIAYYREHKVDVVNIVIQLIVVFICVGLLQILYYFFVSRHYRPSKLDISRAFIDRIKFHLSG